MSEQLRCVCGHTCDQHANIGGCGVCRVHPCPCEKWHEKPMPEECECDGCWRESNAAARSRLTPLSDIQADLKHMGILTEAATEKVLKAVRAGQERITSLSSPASYLAAGERLQAEQAKRAGQERQGETP